MTTSDTSAAAVLALMRRIDQRLDHLEDLLAVQSNQLQRLEAVLGLSGSEPA